MDLGSGEEGGGPARSVGWDRGCVGLGDRGPRGAAAVCREAGTAQGARRGRRLLFVRACSEKVWPDFGRGAVGCMVTITPSCF